MYCGLCPGLREGVRWERDAPRKNTSIKECIFWLPSHWLVISLGLWQHTTWVWKPFTPPVHNHILQSSQALVMTTSKIKLRSPSRVINGIIKAANWPLICHSPPSPPSKKKSTRYIPKPIDSSGRKTNPGLPDTIGHDIIIMCAPQSKLPSQDSLPLAQQSQAICF